MKQLQKFLIQKTSILQSSAALRSAVTFLNIFVLLIIFSSAGGASINNSGTQNIKVSCTHLKNYSLDIDSDNIPDLNINIDNSANTMRAHAIGFDLAIDDDMEGSFGIKVKPFVNGETLNITEILKEQALLFSQSTGSAISTTVENTWLKERTGCIGLYTSDDHPAYVRMSFNDDNNDDLIDTMYLLSWGYEDTLDTITFTGCKPVQTTVTVCESGCKYTSIKEAVESSGENTVILVNGGTYDESSVNIDNDITVKTSQTENVSITFDSISNGSEGKIILNDKSTLNISQNLSNYGTIQADGGGTIIFSNDDKEIVGRMFSSSVLSGFDEIKFAGEQGQRWLAPYNLRVEGKLTVDGVYLYADCLDHTGVENLLNNGVIIKATSIPSLNEWGIICMLFLLTIFSIMRMRRKTHKIIV